MQGCVILESVDVKELQSLFGKPLQAETKKILQRILKQTGWKRLNLLHISASRQGSGLPEMLYWVVELFNRLAGELGEARWEVPFERTTFVDPVILPSGQVVSPAETADLFVETAKKLNIGLLVNSGQVKPFPGKLAVRGNRLVIVQGGAQHEIQDRKQLEDRLGGYFHPKKIPALTALPWDDIAAQVVTEDDFGLYQAVLKSVTADLKTLLEPSNFQVIVVHNFRPVGLIPFIRSVLPGSLVIWRNHLQTAAPTPAVWNYFVPLINQAHGAMYLLPEYNPNDQADVLPIMAPSLMHVPSIYPFSPKNRELDGLGVPVVKRVLAQYQRDYILAAKFDLKDKIERAYLKVTGNRATDVQVEAVLDSLTKASIRAAFIEEERRPEVERFVTKSSATQAGMIELVRQLHGIDPSRPLFTQISRYDRFKDPVGTTRAFAYAYLRLAHEKMPLEERPQFVYAGIVEDHSPQAFEELVKVFLFLQHLKEEVAEELRDFPAGEHDELCRQLRHDIFILVLPTHDRIANAIEVNALQRSSRAVIQKSLRESFGLALTEAMWKGVPVIGANLGGIRLQIDHGTNGFLAGQVVDGELQDSVEDTAQYIMTYARHLDVAVRMGEMGKRKVSKEFLLPVNLNIFLQKVADLLSILENGPKAEKSKKDTEQRPVE